MRRVILRLILLAALLGCLALSAMKHVFVIREISVSGNDGIPAEFVISASGLEPGQGMFRLNTETVKNGICGLGSHEFESLERNWPDGIHIVLRPREKMAMALCTGGTAVLDGECIVMEILPEAPDCDLIYISGFDRRGANAGQRLRMDDAQAEICIKLLAAIADSGADAYISEIDLSDAAAPKLVLRSGCTALLEDGENLQEKMAWLRLLAQDMEHRGERGGVLLISRTGCADYIPASEQDAYS